MTFPSALPAPRQPDPRDAPVLRWGVLAPGGIAGTFVEAVLKHSDQRITAVGSRDAARARAFADRFEIPRAYDDYAQLVADPDVDVVYVASPHSAHHDQALLAIAAGKHVLVEKSFTQTAAQATAVMEAAAEAGVVAMEAMWTRFLPSIDVVRQLLADGVLGDLIEVAADHGQYMRFDPLSRLFDPQLAGGALLDLGVYPVSFASFVLGEPTAIVATGTLTSTGVDGRLSAIMTGRTTDGAAAVPAATVSTTLQAKTPTTAAISGTAARIEIPGEFYTPQPVTLIGRDGDRLTWDDNRIIGHEGLVFQAAELARVVGEGRPGSDLLPAPETISIIATMDEIRRQVGVVLPGD